MHTPTNPAERRRQRRARELGEDILNLHAGGITGTNLRQRVLTGKPADLEETPKGWVLRLWGIETPPCLTETVAITTWARMATGRPVLTPDGKRAPSDEGTLE